MKCSLCTLYVSISPEYPNSRQPLSFGHKRHPLSHPSAKRLGTGVAGMTRMSSTRASATVHSVRTAEKPGLDACLQMEDGVQEGGAVACRVTLGWLSEWDSLPPTAIAIINLVALSEREREGVILAASCARRWARLLGSGA